MFILLKACFKKMCVDKTYDFLQWMLKTVQGVEKIVMLRQSSQRDAYTVPRFYSNIVLAHHNCVGFGFNS